MKNIKMCSVTELDSTYLSSVEEIAKCEGLTETSLTLEPASSKGNNYLSCIHRVTVNGNRNGEPIILNFIIKTSANDNIRDTFPVEIPYKRETFAYNVVFKELKKIQNETNDGNVFFSFVKCFYAIEEYMKEIVVLEDLTPQGFIMYDRLKSVDLDHAALVVTSLAKLHALSYVLKSKDLEIFDDLASKCPDILANGPFGKTLEPVFRASTEMIQSVIDDPKILPKLQEFSENIMKRMQNATKPGKYGVFCHGDCWTNNILFKYREGVPVDARLLDYQFMRYGSPAVDLLYFIFCCSDRRFRTQYYNKMLDMYYETLTECLRGHSLDIKSIMPKDAFLQEIKDFSDYGLGMFTLTIRSFAAEAAETQEMKELFSGTEVTVKLPTGNSQLIVQRVKEVVGDFYEYGYFD